MRRARITYTGAFHHAMNRGHSGLPIFKNKEEKNTFLNLMKKNSKKCKISIHAFCVMDNHYHMIVQNNSGRMSDFFKRTNGEFGTIYRKEYGGKGYVFQDRFTSTLIQMEHYLLNVYAYVLNNPVEAGIVKDFVEYEWSSAMLYFNESGDNIIDNSFIKDSFENFQAFKSFINKNRIKSLPFIKTKRGHVLGDKKFIEEAEEKYDRRKTGDNNLSGKRESDIYFESIEKILYEFENKFNIDPYKLDTTAFEGKRLRGELLINLKGLYGLTYKEIYQLDFFSDVKFNSLGRMYKDAKRRKSES